MRRVWRDNGLSIVFFLLFVCTWLGQSLTGYAVHQADQREHHQPTQSWARYLDSPAFLEATAENWESEFLQMAAFAVLTAFLYQRGSAESKDPDRREATDREPDPDRRGAPWPVRRGGLALRLYRNSLAIAFLSCFLLSFVLHAVGGAAEYNEERTAHASGARLSVVQYMGTARFWFESLQNWQSEFLAVFSIVVFTIFLRQKGSPQSKPVDAPHSQTGGG